MEHAPSHECIDPGPGFKGWIELQQGFWPEESRMNFFFDFRADAIVLDVKKTPDKIPIIRNQPIAELKDIHTGFSEQRNAAEVP
jgi:hypothetical protein